MFPANSSNETFQSHSQSDNSGENNHREEIIEVLQPNLAEGKWIFAKLSPFLCLDLVLPLITFCHNQDDLEFIYC